MSDADAYTVGASAGGEEVPSPCINVCTIDPGTGWCLGCYRSLDEIAGWRDFSAEEKRAVLACLPGRRPRPAE